MILFDFANTAARANLWMVSIEPIKMYLLLISYHSYQLIEHAVIELSFGCLMDEVDLDCYVKKFLPRLELRPQATRLKHWVESAFKILLS
jgi:hypothetical protein